MEPCTHCGVMVQPHLMRRVDHLVERVVREEVFCPTCYGSLVYHRTSLGWQKDILRAEFMVRSDDPMIRFQQLINEAKIELEKIIADPNTPKAAKLRAMNNREWLNNLRYA